LLTFLKDKAGNKKYFSNVDISKAYGSKDNVIIANSDFLNGLTQKAAKSD
jgi:leucyl-tRNA synthetase